jgi:prevent-host-death family protein
LQFVQDKAQTVGHFMAIDQAAPKHFLTAGVLSVKGVVEDFHGGFGSWKCECASVHLGGGLQFDSCENSSQTRQITSQKEVQMQTWPVQDAKARFSEFLDACLVEGPQMVTRRGAEAAVLVPVQEWRRIQSAARPSLKQLLLSDQARTDLIAPARGQAKRRPVGPMQ